MFAVALPPGIDFKFKALKFKRVATSNHLPDVIYTENSLDEKKKLLIEWQKNIESFAHIQAFNFINAKLYYLLFKVYSRSKHKQISCCLVCVNSARRWDKPFFSSPSCFFTATKWKAKKNNWWNITMVHFTVQENIKNIKISVVFGCFWAYFELAHSHLYASITVVKRRIIFGECVGSIFHVFFNIDRYFIFMHYFFCLFVVVFSMHVCASV